MAGYGRPWPAMAGHGRPWPVMVPNPWLRSVAPDGPHDDRTAPKSSGSPAVASQEGDPHQQVSDPGYIRSISQNVQEQTDL